MMDSDQDNWVTVQEAALLLSKSERTIRRWVETDKLAYKREGRRLYVNVAGYVHVEVTTPDLQDLQIQVAKLTTANEHLSIENERLWSTLATLTTQKAIEAAKERGRPWWMFWKN